MFGDIFFLNFSTAVETRKIFFIFFIQILLAITCTCNLFLDTLNLLHVCTSCNLFLYIEPDRKKVIVTTTTNFLVAKLHVKFKQQV